MMNSLKLCVVFLSVPPPTRELCETLARLEREVMVAMAIPAGFLDPEPCLADLVEYMPFEMIPETTCDEPILTREVHHEVTQTHGTKPPPNPRPRRTVGAWDGRWG